MSALPERYRPYAEQAAGQLHQPTVVYQPQPVDQYEERPPIAWVADPYNPGRSVAVDARLIQPAQPSPARDLAPQPLLDPIAQRFVGAGVGGGVALWGGGQFLAGAGQLISGLSGVGALLFFLALAGARVISRPAGTRIQQTVHVQQKWFGRHTTNL